MRKYFDPNICISGFIYNFDFYHEKSEHFFLPEICTFRAKILPCIVVG